MIYQDLWINGKLVKKGIRDCASRYDVIYEYCKTIKVNSVLDIGANMSYFGLRLIEDFGCYVMAFEFDHFNIRLDHVKANDTNKLMLLNRKLTIPDLKILRDCCKFDLVLAMSVIHHLPGDTGEWINIIRSLAKYTIMEFALEDSNRIHIRKNYKIPDDSTILGYGKSHLKKDFNRPIILLK